ncbi:MAG TPA: hypothetical protein VFJ85_20000 [Acidimicrobiales bacterium]|nr:hypothetical protein [Acidimicrobiales bacterium]
MDAIFVAVHGGKAMVGVTAEERAFLDPYVDLVGLEEHNLPPSASVVVSDFIVSCFPVSYQALDPLGLFDIDQLRARVAEPDSWLAPAMLDEDETRLLCERLNVRCVTEVEWEYLYRPTWDALHVESLEPESLVGDVLASSVRVAEDVPGMLDARGVGLLQVGEACAPSVPGVGRSRRGGAASLVPWQGCGEEALLCPGVQHDPPSSSTRLAVRIACSLRDD